MELVFYTLLGTIIAFAAFYFPLFLITDYVDVGSHIVFAVLFGVTINNTRSDLL